MKSTFRILFYLKKNEPKKDGTVTIMARITVDGETKQFSTKKTILPEDWDIKSGRAVNKSGKSTSAKISKLNKELDDLRGQISIQYTKQLNNNGYVEPEKLRNNVLGIEESSTACSLTLQSIICNIKIRWEQQLHKRPIHVTN